MKHLSWRYKDRCKKRSLASTHHHEAHVISAKSCLVKVSSQESYELSCFHIICGCNYVIFKNEKCKVRGSPKVTQRMRKFMYKYNGFLGVWKVIWKLESHERSSRVPREVRIHLICYIYTLIAQDEDFSPWLLKLGIGEKNRLLRRK